MISINLRLMIIFMLLPAKSYNNNNKASRWEARYYSKIFLQFAHIVPFAANATPTNITLAEILFI